MTREEKPVAPRIILPPPNSDSHDWTAHQEDEGPRSKASEADEMARGSQEFAQATINALSEHICVLDRTGLVLGVNQAWRAFAAANPPVLQNVCENANYLAVCDNATGEGADQAAAFAAGIRSVVNG